MNRIIKLLDSDERSIAEFEHVMLEAIGHGQAGENIVDPAAIIEAARAEAKEKVQEAYQEGLRRGTEAGKTQFLESVGEAAQVLETAATALSESREAFTSSLESQLSELVFAIASRVLLREATLSPEVVQTTTRSLLEILFDQERVVLHVNPKDLDVMSEHRIELLKSFQGIKTLDVVADDSVAPGGCIAESDALHVDGRLESQIQQILTQIDQH